MFASGLVQEPFVAGAGTQIAHLVIRFCLSNFDDASLSYAIREQPRRSMQDQQKQTRDQHNGSYPCYGQYQCLRRRVVTYTPALHDQNPIQKSWSS
jgi:hypothetical protein